MKVFGIIWVMLLMPMDRTALHPMHISVAEIAWDERDKALEMTLRIFADDLETTLRKATGIENLDVQQPEKSGSTLDVFMKKYLSGKFEIALDGKLQKQNYLGHERDGDAFVFYIEVPGIRKWRSIQITNSILTEVFEDQSNLVHVTVRNEVKSLRLTRGTVKDQLEFIVK